MRFEVYVEMQGPEGVDQHRLYWDIMQQLEFADRMGYEVFSTIDHHFFPEFGISSNPLAFWSAAAQRTRGIRFRTLLHNMSLHNPMVLAGQITAADHLTRGRLELGLGRGHAWEFPKADVPLDRARPRSVDAIEILLRALAGQRFSYSGDEWSTDNLEVVPRPFQHSYKIYTGGTSDSTYREAGRRGWGIVVPPLLPHRVLKNQFDIYREACAASGHQPDIVFLHAIYMDHDESRIRAEAGDALQGFLANNAGPTRDLPPKEDLTASGFDFYASGILEGLAAKSYEEITSEGIVWVGTPQRIIEYIKEIESEIEGLTALALVPNFGGLEHWKSIKTLQIFADTVIPHFDRAGARPAPDEPPDGDGRAPR